MFLYRLGRACVQHRWRTIGVWLIAAVALIGLNNTVGGQMTNGFVVPGLDSQEAYDLLADRGTRWFSPQRPCSANCDRGHDSGISVD